jgi:hypothetical protein
LSDSQSLVATLTHELSHHLLLGDGILTTDVADHEQITDLHAVYRGIGVFAANSTVRESHEESGQSHSWRVGKQGYLTSREYGYALAVFCWARQEANPAWQSELRLDARSSLDSGVRYLRKHQDCLLDDENAISLETTSTADVLKGLQSSHESVRVATLWSISQLGLNSPEVVESVSVLLAHKNPILRREAAEMLGTVVVPSDQLTDKLVDRLEDKSPKVRAAAAIAVGKHKPHANIAMPHLRFLLEDTEREVVESALECARCYGADAEPQLPRILQVLRSAMVDCDYRMCELALRTVEAVVPNSTEVIKDHFEADHDLKSAVESLLADSAEAA